MKPIKWCDARLGLCSLFLGSFSLLSFRSSILTVKVVLLPSYENTKQISKCEFFQTRCWYFSIAANESSSNQWYGLSIVPWIKIPLSSALPNYTIHNLKKHSFRAAVPIEKLVAIGLWILGARESYHSTSVTPWCWEIHRTNILKKIFGALFYVREDNISFLFNGRALKNVMSKFKHITLVL